MKEFFAILIMVVLALVLAVSLQPADLAPVEEMALVLQEKGFAVSAEKPEGNGEFLHGERYRLILNENPETNVTMYVYKNIEEAQKEAGYINKDGFGIDYTDGLGFGQSVQISWVDAPHFFLYKNIIVQYIGSDWDVLSSIETLCGEQIAGQPYYETARIGPEERYLCGSPAAFLRVTVAGGQPDCVRLEIVNGSEEEIHYGEPYKLYKAKDGGWEWINSDMAFIMPLYTLPAGHQEQQECYFTEPLEPGTYRITKEISSGKPDGNSSDTVTISADFTIK